MSAITELAKMMLDEKEFALAEHLSVILGDDKYNSLLVMRDILPVYWKQEGNHRLALPPRSIFKTLYYVEATAGMREFGEKTRDFLADVAGHLEGCLYHLLVDADKYTHPNLPFGRLVEALRRNGTIPEELAAQLQAYNRTANVSSKHFDAFPPRPGLHERTFSVLDAACAFVMMRKLSMQLFPLLRAKGEIGEVAWPPFDDLWLKLFPLIDQRPASTRG